ncbi:uncharacterized protein [Prorops nasuta]|uniref:uncharacterized protein n=1 Tax=Prorops nasuta TaxID=863751 RepID=UPI0034CE0F1E
MNIHRFCGKMVSSLKMTPWLMAFICLATAGCSNVTDQQTSETHHDQQVAILKQIRKVNEDGSYTYGYEAGDGSFKEHISVVQSIPRLNRTTTTKRPAIVYASSTAESSTKSSVVQSIPRTRKITTTSTTTTTEAPKTTIFSHYLRGSSKSRPRFIINSQQRPIILESERSSEDEDSQINRPVTEDKQYRRLVFAKRPVDHDLRPISEDFAEKDDDKITTGNSLRRQLQDETTKANVQVDNSNNHHGENDEHSDVYGGSLSTSRPLFTTSTTPRVLPRVSSLRAERPKMLFVNRDVGPARFDNSKYEGPRVYENEPKAVEEDRPVQQILIRAPASPRDFVRPEGEPIYVRPQADQYGRELPDGRILVPAQANLDEETSYRAIPIGRLLLRPVDPRRPIYTSTTDANVHYLTDNPMAQPEIEPPVDPNYVRPVPRPLPPRPMIYAEPEPRPRPILRPLPAPVPPHPDERDYPQSTPEYPYRVGAIALPPEPPNPIAPPLSRRDFQHLLRRLLVSQYGARALAYPKTYLEDALYDQQPYPSYQSSYQAPAPRQELAYEPGMPGHYGERVPLRRPVYSRLMNPVYQVTRYDDYPDGRYAKRVYRQKYYAHEVADEGDEILPPPIREALLLRMLQLAINSEKISMAPTTVVTTTTTPSSRYRKSGPIRSVQIITDQEDEDGDKDDLAKKM